jgi:hypothetical protein
MMAKCKQIHVWCGFLQTYAKDDCKKFVVEHTPFVLEITSKAVLQNFRRLGQK